MHIVLHALLKPGIYLIVHLIEKVVVHHHKKSSFIFLYVIQVSLTQYFFFCIGGDTSSLGPVDGFDMWDALDQGYASPREEILLNVDPLDGNLALRHQQYKVYLSKNNTVSDTFEIPGGRRPVNDLRELRRNSETARVLRDFYKEESSWQPSSHLDNSGMVDCEKSAKTIGGLELGKSPFLFDIEKDPCEFNNLAKSEKKVR